MDLRSRYESQSKQALIDELLALREQREIDPPKSASSILGVTLSDLEQLLLDHPSEAVILTDRDAKIQHWNIGAEKMFGYAADKVTGRIVGEVLHPTLDDKYRLDIKRGLESEGRWTGELPILCKDGSLILCDSVILKRFDDDGQYLGTIGVNRNTGWQDKAEEALAQQQTIMTQLDGREAELAESLQRYSELIECIPDVVWTVDIDGVITYMSPVTESVTGFKPAELVGKHLYETQDIALNATEPETVLRTFDNLLHPDNRDDGFVTRSIYRRADGSLLDAEIRVSPQLDAEGNVVGLSGITRDVSDIVQAQEARLRLEAQLMQAQKMEAIGQLAGGIAHDLNNVLTAIMGHTDLMLEDTEATNFRFTGLTEISKSSQRAARLVKNLLAFSRQQELRPQLVDLCALVVQMEDFLSGLLDGTLGLSVKTASQPLWVLADPTQLEQVVLNLIINARDAITLPGQISVDVAPIALTTKAVADLPDGPYVRLSVTDSGEGIEPAALPRVFEPFYTTKKPNQGTGLGLSSAYGIIQQSGGSIDVVSEIGDGATFNVYLPLVSGALASASLELSAEPSESQKKRETILIAEDNPEVGGMLKQTLQRNGYSVLLAPSGEEALAIARRTIGRIDLLITDYAMPGMSGFELSRAFAPVHREAKVLQISGYGEEPLTESSDDKSTLNFLSKPFGPRVLLERVRAILDGPEHQA